MITVGLKLRYSPHAIRSTEAWYIPGNDLAAWLAEVTRWDVAQESLRLWPLPSSNSDRTPAGVLVMLAHGPVPTQVSSRCIAFGKIVGQLYLPTDAWLEPDLSEAELEAEFAPGNLYVWHAAVGLVAFEPQDGIEIATLLSATRPRARRWNRAQPGISLAPRLTAIKPEEMPSPEMVLDRSQGDIGSERDQLLDLPPSMLEPPPGLLNSSSRQGTRMLASMILWLTQRLPATSDESTWANKLEDWAKQKLSNFYAGLNAARHKELARLMEMLESDPDRGLRFALPLAGDAHRGIAPPGGRLVERPTNFSLNPMGRGGAADIWDLSSDYRQQLTARYRELANREMSLGRHRRAAYIFAELLGDFHAAAGALTEGHHWREAAVLYQKRLNRTQDAVRCLESGGLWNEAIELYIELQEFEKAGDLYLRLEQTDAASVQYRKAVAKSRGKGDLLGSARLLESKLAAPDEALEELDSGWPNSSQASQCLRKSFQLLGRLGRHEAVERRMEQFREEPLPNRNRLELVDIIADTAIKYPDRNVQSTAADCTRVLVSRQLRGATKNDASHLLSAITRLVPTDRLLSRDCQKFLQQREVAPPARRIEPPKPRGKEPRLVRVLQFPSKLVTWKTATSSGNMVVAAGHHKHHIVAGRSSWLQLDPEARIWKTSSPEPDTPIIMAMPSQREDFVLIHQLGTSPLPNELTFEPTDGCPFTTKIGAIRGMSNGLLAADGTSHGILWMLEVRDLELTLIAIGTNGQLISTETMPVPQVSPEFADRLVVMPVPFHARSEARYIGWYNKLLVYEKDKPQRTVEFAQPIQSLVGSAPFTLTRLVATFAQGGMVLWDDYEGEHGESFGQDLANPLVCINRKGYLIAVSEKVGEVYYTHGRKLQFESQFKLTGSKPIAVLSCSHSNQFGIFTESGEFFVYEMA